MPINSVSVSLQSVVLPCPLLSPRLLASRSVRTPWPLPTEPVLKQVVNDPSSTARSMQDKSRLTCPPQLNPPKGSRRSSPGRLLGPLRLHLGSPKARTHRIRIRARLVPRTSNSSVVFADSPRSSAPLPSIPDFFSWEGSPRLKVQG